VRFYPGINSAAWLWLDGRGEFPVCVSVARLGLVKRWRPAIRAWMLDSGAFTVVQREGKHLLSPAEYVALVRRAADEIGRLDFAAPQDMMCEPAIIEGGWWGPAGRQQWFHGTGLDVPEHLRPTVENLLDLRMADASLPIRLTLQGWTRDDYHRCWDLYERHGVHLEDEPLVLLGSMCRRQDTAEADQIVRSLAPLRLHGFGVKTGGLAQFGHRLVSADSSSWSDDARRPKGAKVELGCSHRTCQNCPRRCAWAYERTVRMVNDRWVQGDLFDPDERWVR